MGYFQSVLKRNIRQMLYGDLKANIKGKLGESKVSWISNYAKLGDNSVTIRNLYLPWSDGGTAQIDQLIIAESGIYVIEVKNYKGWIFGNEKNQYWTQVLSTGYRGQSIKNKLYNPLKQNATHIYCLKKHLNGFSIPYYSIVVFSNDAEFKNVTIDSDNAYVIHNASLKGTLERLHSRYRGAISGNDIALIHGIITNASSAADRENHVDNVKKQIREKEERLEKRLCPRCGAPLVVRTAKCGPNAGSKFLGCSRYPNCRYTHSLD